MRRLSSFITMLRRFWFLLIAVVSLSLTSSAEELTAINALFDRIEQAYGNRSTQLLTGCLSDAFVAIIDLPNNPSGAIVFNKNSILRALAPMFTKGTSQQLHQFIKRDIKVQESLGLAFLLTTTLDKWSDGRTVVSEGFRIACQEQEAWRMVLAMPLLFRPTVMITEVTPSGQASRLGLHHGDCISFYAGEEIKETAQLQRAVQRHAGDASGTKIMLKVTRGKDDLQYQVEPGELGAKTQTRLLPADGAHLIGAQEPHAIKETAGRIAKAIQHLDTNAYLAEASPGGLLIFFGTPTQPHCISGPDAAQHLQGYWQAVSASIDPKSWECKESRAIIKGNIGLVALRWSAKDKTGKIWHDVELYAFARQNGRWRFVADLPVSGIDIGLDPPLLSQQNQRLISGAQPRARNSSPLTAQIVSNPDAVLLNNFDSGDDPLISPSFPNAKWRAEKGSKLSVSICGVEPNDGAAGTPCSLKWSYRINDTWASVGLLLSGSWEKSVDLSSYESISFYVKGLGKRWCVFKVATAPWKESSPTWGEMPVRITPEWRKVEIPLKASPLFQNNNLARTYSVSFVDWDSQETSSGVVVDQIQLHKNYSWPLKLSSSVESLPEKIMPRKTKCDLTEAGIASLYAIMPEFYDGNTSEDQLILYRKLVGELPPQAQCWILSMGQFIEDRVIDSYEREVLEFLSTTKDPLAYLTSPRIMDGVDREDIAWAKAWQRQQGCYLYLDQDINQLLKAGLIDSSIRPAFDSLAAKAKQDFDILKGLYLIGNLGRPPKGLFQWRHDALYNTQLLVLCKLLERGVPEEEERLAIAAALDYGANLSVASRDIWPDIIAHAHRRLEFIRETTELLKKQGADWDPRCYPLEADVALLWPGVCASADPFGHSEPLEHIFRERPMGREAMQSNFASIGTLREMRDTFLQKGLFSYKKDLEEHIQRHPFLEGGYDQRIDIVADFAHRRLSMADWAESYPPGYRFKDINWQWRHVKETGKIAGACVDWGLVCSFFERSLNIAPLEAAHSNWYYNPQHNGWNCDAVEQVIRCKDLTNCQHAFAKFPWHNFHMIKNVGFETEAPDDYNDITDIFLLMRLKYMLLDKSIPVGYVLRRITRLAP